MKYQSQPDNLPLCSIKLAQRKPPRKFDAEMASLK